MRAYIAHPILRKGSVRGTAVPIQARHDRVMRTNNTIKVSALLSTMLAVGCGYQATTGGKRGETLKQHAGTVSVVFTNASPDKVCGLHMSFDGEPAHGDNWLPADGLASGKSIEFKVKPGKYKATWNTCTSSEKPYYAATLVHDWAFDVKDSTQLFAYVADTVAPTKRAAPKDFYKMVKFPGQKIEPGKTVARRDSMAMQDAAAVADAHVNPNDPNAKTAQPTEKFDAKDWVEKPKAGKRKVTKIKPSLDRDVDVSNAKVKYAASN